MKTFFRRDWFVAALEARDQRVVLRLYVVGLVALMPPAAVVALLGGASWAIYSALPLVVALVVAQYCLAYGESWLGSVGPLWRKRVLLEDLLSSTSFLAIHSRAVVTATLVFAILAVSAGIVDLVRSGPLVAYRIGPWLDPKPPALSPSVIAFVIKVARALSLLAIVLLLVAFLAPLAVRRSRLRRALIAFLWGLAFVLTELTVALLRSVLG